MSTEYANALGHPVDLADGKVLGPEDTATLTAEQERDEHNAALVADGTLVKVDKRSRSEQKGD